MKGGTQSVGPQAERHPLEVVCDRLATATGAERLVMPGAGHQVQHLGSRFNAELEAFLDRAEPATGSAAHDGGHATRA